MRIPSAKSMLLAILLIGPAAFGQSLSDWLGDLPRPKDYVQKRISSYDRTGANDDSRPIDPGQTLTLLDEKGPGEITHVWITIASGEKYHLKKLVLRMYWTEKAIPVWKRPLEIFLGWETASISCTNRSHCKWARRKR